MPKVKGTYTHSLSVVEVVRRSANAVEELLDSFEATDIEITDNGTDEMAFSCEIRGFSISGEVSISDDDIEVVVDLPFFASSYKGRVRDAMDKRIPKYLEEKEPDDEP